MKPGRGKNSFAGFEIAHLAPGRLDRDSPRFGLHRPERMPHDGPCTTAPVLVAPDSFKGTLRGRQVAAAIGRGLESGGLPRRSRPVADGGEGTSGPARAPRRRARQRARTIRSAARSTRELRAARRRAHGARRGRAGERPRPVAAQRERDAEAASSAGTGELIVAAIACGACAVLVAAGGSASTDGGGGAIDAMAAAGGLRGARPPCSATCARRSSRPRRSSPRRRAPSRRPSRVCERRLERVAHGCRGSSRDADEWRRRRARGRVLGGLRRATRAGRVVRARRASASIARCSQAAP